MSGESPREEKVEVLTGRLGAERSYRNRTVCDTVTPTWVRQLSRQQPMACWPFGQQSFGETSECETAAVWQLVDIKGAATANAAMGPCRPMTSIRMTAISLRGMTITITRPRYRVQTL